MAWVPGFESFYNDPPITGLAPRAVVGRCYHLANKSANSGLARNADGYVLDNMPRAKKQAVSAQVTSPPLPPALQAAVRAAQKARGVKVD